MKKEKKELDKTPSTDFSQIEKKWQAEWEKAKIFQVSEDKKKKKFYVLEMYPYPSASGLHMGHALNYTIGDIQARTKRMQGFNVLYPMGFDSFGLPAENAAIQAKSHPKKFTEESIKNYMKQMKELGLSYDWSRLIMSHNPSYYHWDQWLFLQMFKKDLAFKKKAAVNFCSKCNTVLANEQVHDGKCWRHKDTDVEIKQLEQWFFKITDYADELYNSLDKPELKEWPDRIKAMQKNWIGKSHGTEIMFEIEDIKNKEFVFLHAYGDTIKDVFWGWLKREIEKRGGKVAFAESLPNTNNPDYKEQSEFVLNHYKFNEKSVVIGHSLGATLIMKLLSSEKIKIDKLVMVAPPLPTEKEIINGKAFRDLNPRPALARYCDWKFDFDQIKKKVNRISVLEDKKDHVVKVGDPKKLAELLGADYTLAIGNKTHYNGEVEEEVLNLIFPKWPIFTTRPDTIYGVTFMVISAQHQKLMSLVAEKQKKEVQTFLKKIKSTSEKDMEDLDKEGAFTGSYAINPITKEKIPIWVGNFVVADYGSGMVMAVPAHDQRDFEFAKKYKIPIKEVIRPAYGEKKEGSEFRRTISAVIHRKKDNKFLLIKWKEFKWVSPAVGGIEGKEDIGKAAEREVFEETGYKVRFIKKLGGETEEHFYAENKKVWRLRIDQPVLLELVSDKPSKVEGNEKALHEPIWVTAEEALKMITHDYNKFGLLRYLGKDKAYIDTGTLVESGEFSGLNSIKAIEEITKYLEKHKLGKRVTQFKLRDWLISRQRFWGTPIPVIYCDKCGLVPVPEKDLPVILPEDIKFKSEKNPLIDDSKFLDIKCPKCGGKAKRETDTMDTFVNSSWYFLRYTDPSNSKEIFDKSKASYWVPVDIYIGGAEHACMHLIYFRFYTKFLRDLGLLKIDEPAKLLFNQGMLHGEDGFVMSKSRGNVVLPEEVSKKYGIDTARLFLVSMASPDKDVSWSVSGIEGSLRIINKIINYFGNKSIKFGKSSPKIESKVNKAIKEITEDIDKFRYNLAVIKIRQLFEAIEQEQVSKQDAESFLKLLHPFCPHITEELWHNIGNKSFLSLEHWPRADEKKINEKLEQQEQAVEKTIQDINNIIKIMKEKQNKEAKKAYLYALPNELNIYKDNKSKIERSINLQITLFAVNDKSKIDPQNKSSKAKPGKPAIYLE